MARSISRFLIVALALAAHAVLPGQSHAQSTEPLPATPTGEEVPVLLRADAMSYDRELGNVVANGHVEVSRDGRILLANSLTYNQRDDILTASGNVSLMEADGTVFFADYVELTGDMKNGIVKDIRIILNDGSRIAANGARRTDGTVHEMTKGVYSPCNLCAKDPSRPPLWQVKAVKVTQDNVQHVVSYEDAWLEVKGVPVAYTPYFSHPDPTVKKKTGFLAPSIGSSSDLGTITKVPYFININPSQDVTLTPIYTSEEGPVLSAEYRQHLRDGKFTATASITEDSQDDIRGHIATDGRFNLDDTWRWGFDVNRSTDDTYTRRYHFQSSETLASFQSSQTLVSRVYTEGFRKRNYFSANAYTFQGLQATDDPGATPLVLPMLDFNHLGEPGKFGGRTRLDGNLAVLSRTDGMDTRRLSVDAGYDIPYIGPMGDIYTLSTSLRGDLYDVNGLERSGQVGSYNGFSDRIIPEIALNWRYPFVQSRGPVLQLFEPIASLVVSPYGGNSDTIPNEDSQDVEFDDTNIFSTNRFPGLDRIEGGPRVNYGFRWGAYGSGGGHTSVLVGQSYRLKKDDTFAAGSGLEDHLSDIVARADIAPSSYLNLSYRTRLDKEDFTARKNEVVLSAGPEALRSNTSYVFFDRQQGNEFATSREEFRQSLTARLDQFWRTGTSVVYDVEEKEPRSYNLNLIYEDECLIFSTNLARTFYSDRDISPSDTILFQVTFKTLGEVSTSAQ